MHPYNISVREFKRVCVCVGKGGDARTRLFAAAHPQAPSLFTGQGMETLHVHMWLTHSLQYLQNWYWHYNLGLSQQAIWIARQKIEVILHYVSILYLVQFDCSILWKRVYLVTMLAVESSWLGLNKLHIVTTQATPTHKTNWSLPQSSIRPESLTVTWAGLCQPT